MNHRKRKKHKAKMRICMKKLYGYVKLKASNKTDYRW